MAQQKQRKQPILVDGKNIFTYCFQPIQRLQRNLTTDGIRNFMAQQKHRKQLHLTDDKNIFTYCFQSIQRLQLNSKTYAIRNFMYTKHNIDNLHTATTTYTTQFYQSYIGNNKPNKHNPNNQNNDTDVGFTTNTKFVLFQLRQRKFWSIHIQILTNFKIFIFKQFRTFHPSLICTFHRS